MSNGKIFLLDGMALIYRAFFAFIQNPRITSTGLNASAMMGFTNTLLEVIKKQKPTHLAVVFDTSAPTQRHIQFEAYKAQREEMPEDLRKSIPYIFRIIEGFNIPVITMDGYEADDIIGTLAWKAGDLGYDVFMMTPDKDFGQLVRDNVKIYKPARMGNGDEILGVEEILKKWEITDPKQVIDILGLWGDASDNIPGVPGVGEKTAKKLIQEYGSMEVILENIDKLKGKMQENFRNFTEQAKVSKWLATIDTQVPIELDLEALKMEPVNEPALREVFEELEFRTLMRRVLGESGGSAEASADSRIGDSSPSRSGGVDLFGNPIAPASPKKAKPQPANQTSMFDQVLEDSESVSEEEVAVYKTIQDVAHEYRIADTEESLLALLEELNGAAEFCFDTETTDVESLHAELVGLSFSTSAFKGWYVPVSSNRDEAVALVDRFKGVLLSSKLKIAQNIKYDITVLQNYGVTVAGPMFDTMLAHYLLEPDQRHNMQLLSEKFLGYTPVSIETLIGKKG
ncbi:MAG: DNA polymerase I, partial [Bacteroidia bacterium]|nr:DNA polymerase I [Bacteroidia bacterium]